MAIDCLDNSLTTRSCLSTYIGGNFNDWLVPNSNKTQNVYNWARNYSITAVSALALISVQVYSAKGFECYKDHWWC